MRSRARAVVIGGGLAAARSSTGSRGSGRDDVVLVERADLTSGLDVSLRRARRPAAQLSLADEDHDGERRPPSRDRRRGRARDGLARGGIASARVVDGANGRRSLEQAGWAKTFGLPLDLISAVEAQELFPPMSTEGVLGAAHGPTDGYVDPLAADVRSRSRCAAAWRRDRDEHPRDRDPRRARPRHRRRQRQRRDRGRGGCERGRGSSRRSSVHSRA